MNLDVIPLTCEELRKLYQDIQIRKRGRAFVGRAKVNEEWNQIWWQVKTNSQCMKRDYLLPKERTDA